VNLSKDSVLIILLVLVVLASGIDLYSDVSHGATLQHTVKEGLIMLFSFAGIVWLLYSLREQQGEISELKAALDSQQPPQRQPEQYVLEARKRFSEMVTQQFSAWDLTRSEKEVGWLLLKGLSLKEIAVIRETLEKTVRQQASAIYRKADLPGRHAFAAWFLEELF
jgi:DNA-binding CsgD family transcriptional regulator